MADRAKVLKKDYDVETAVAVISFLESGNKLEVKLDSLPPEIVRQAALHGLNQKLGDAASGLQGAEAEEAVTSVYEQIVAGQWNATREKGEAAPSLIAMAVFRFKEKLGKLNGETFEQIAQRYAGKEGAKLRAEAMKRKEVAAIVQEIKIERAQAALAKLQESGAATEANTDNL